MPQLDFSMYPQAPQQNAWQAAIGGYQQAQQLRMQQEQQRALQEQRQAIAEQRRQQTDKLRGDAERQAAGDAALDELFSTFEPGKPINTASVGKLYRAYGAEKGAAIVKGLADFSNSDITNADTLRKSMLTRITAIEALPAARQEAAYNAVVQDYIQRGAIRPEEAAPFSVEQLGKYKELLQGPPKLTERDPTKDLTDPQGKVVVPGVPAPVKVTEPGTFDAAILQAHRAGNVAEVRRLSTLKREASDAGRAPAGDGSKFWVMRDGKPLRVSENEYRPGDTPASTREQGRPVTSGDAGRIAEFDTSLDDLKVLRQTIAPVDATGKPVQSGSTGTRAAFEAWVPKSVTDLTGYGTGAKTKQAVIDRVKQVIGKALEGGVLRKEDEYKYTKILPTIGDTADVVKAKLDGLDQAIVLRRSRQIDALEDSGYDVGKFRARDAKPADDTAKKAADLIKKYGGG